MSESTKKKLFPSREFYNADLLKKLHAKYGLSMRFIKQSIVGTRTSETSIKIQEDYNRWLREINKTLKNLEP